MCSFRLIKFTNGWERLWVRCLQTALFVVQRWHCHFACLEAFSSPSNFFREFHKFISLSFDSMQFNSKADATDAKQQTRKFPAFFFPFFRYFKKTFFPFQRFPEIAIMHRIHSFIVVVAFVFTFYVSRTWNRLRMEVETSKEVRKSPEGRKERKMKFLHGNFSQFLRGFVGNNPRLFSLLNRVDFSLPQILNFHIFHVDVHSSSSIWPRFNIFSISSFFMSRTLTFFESGSRKGKHCDTNDDPLRQQKQRNINVWQEREGKSN